MTHHDPISDLLTRIRNGKDANHRFVDVSLSKMNKAIIEVLKDRGYVDQYLINDKKGIVRVFIRVSKRSRKPVIQGLKRASKPGLRRYVKSHEIPKVYSGLGVAIVSTSHGVIDGEKAREMRLGGELLCLIW